MSLWLQHSVVWTSCEGQASVLNRSIFDFFFTLCLRILNPLLLLAPYSRGNESLEGCFPCLFFHCASVSPSLLRLEVKQVRDSRPPVFPCPFPLPLDARRGLRILPNPLPETAAQGLIILAVSVILDCQSPITPGQCVRTYFSSDDATIHIYPLTQGPDVTGGCFPSSLWTLFRRSLPSSSSPSFGSLRASSSMFPRVHQEDVGLVVLSPCSGSPFL